MPLYLDEIWLNASDPETARRSLTVFQTLAREAAPYPEGVRRIAGPWFSNEDARVVLVLDIADHEKTFSSFAQAMVAGLIVRRRLTPIVGPEAVDELVRALGPG
jgi:hypothetical protein